MSSRTIRRLLGSNSLERKCRLLFGACLLLLIFGSFWWYGKETEKLVHRQNRRTGQHLVKAVLMKHHWEQWEKVKPDERILLRRHIAALDDLDYKWEFLTLERPAELSEEVWKECSTALVAKGDEAGILVDLKTDYEQQLAKENDGLLQDFRPEIDQDDAGADDLEVAEPEYQPGDELFTQLVPIYREKRLKSRTESEYLYYQPVYWNTDCVRCHEDMPGSKVRPPDPEETPWLAETDSAAPPQLLLDGIPFRVAKVVFDDPTRREISKNRSILLATAIVTVFLAMVALYAVVRYVIVKPLKHLQDVSDEIANGNYSMRADLQTNDEFEHLAESYNRMLRHLVDSQEQLRQANTELDNRLDQLAQLNMELYETNRLKSDFLANTSHELRTPLNSIIGFSDVLQSIESLNEKQKRYVTNIGQSGRVLLDMINDILDLAKLESGKMDIRPAEFSIESLVRAQCDMIRTLSEEKNIDLEVDCPTGLPDMYQDQRKVQQILTNLLSNAIKFTPEGGRITVSVARVNPAGEPSQLGLCVEDTGVGIAEEDRAVIFEKFRQAKATAGRDNLAREFSGTGLGLSIVKELCKLLGGEVTFESHLGRGSAFTVYLPWSIPSRVLEAARRQDAMLPALALDAAESLSRRREAGTAEKHGLDDAHVSTSPHTPAAPTNGENTT